MIHGPVLVLFHGGTGSGAAERLVARARATAARVSAQRALAAGFERVIIATDDPREIDEARPGVQLDIDPGGEPFAFDRRLLKIIDRWVLARPAVMGAGALPLFSVSDFATLASTIAGDQPTCVTNNFYSADVTAWFPGEALLLVGPFQRDNSLPRLLRDRAGLPVTALPRTTATQFDLDTPTDIALLGLHPAAPAELKTAADEVAPIVSRAMKVMPALCNRNAEIVVSGRVGSQAWQYLERETACRVRLYSEERGLATAPPGYRPRSALGFIIDHAGPERLFRLLQELGHAALLDTRVLMAHADSSASREDRFQSDLFAPDLIEDRWLRSLTTAAGESPQPLLLGGHTLVSGGLMALNDAAWTAHEAAPDLV